MFSRFGWCHMTKLPTLTLWIRPLRQDCSCLTFWVWARHGDACPVLHSVSPVHVKCEFVSYHACVVLLSPWLGFSFEKTPVGQVSATRTVPNSAKALLATWVQPEHRKANENIQHNQTLSYTVSTENITSHCGYWRSLKISQEDNSLHIRWQLFSSLLLVAASQWLHTEYCRLYIYKGCSCNYCKRFLTCKQLFFGRNKFLQEVQWWF